MVNWCYCEPSIEEKNHKILKSAVLNIAVTGCSGSHNECDGCAFPLLWMYWYMSALKWHQASACLWHLGGHRVGLLPGDGGQPGGAGDPHVGHPAGGHWGTPQRVLRNQVSACAGFSQGDSF